MPWCDTCDRFYNPNSVSADGSCPTCGTALPKATRAERRQATQTDTAEEPSRVPWHFWILVVALVIYLGWRLVQLIGWLLR